MVEEKEYYTLSSLLHVIGDSIEFPFTLKELFLGSQIVLVFAYGLTF